MNIRVRVGGGLMAVALIVSACSGVATSPGGDDGGNQSGPNCTEVESLVAETAGMSPEEREAYLLEAARQNGENVSLYTSLNIENGSVVVEMFQEAYDIDVDLFRAGDGDVRLRVLEEAAAGFRGFDLIELESLQLTILDGEGILGPASSPYRAGIVEAGLFDRYTADRVNYLVPVWNTTIYTTDQVPQSFSDLADPRFAGEMALESSDVYWFAVLVEDMVSQGMTEEEAVDVFRSIAANSSITSGHTATLELVLAGQFGVTPNAYAHRAEEFKKEGAPVEWLPVNVPVVAEIAAVAVACQPRNPAGAMLMEDFFLKPETVQDYYVSVNRTPANVEKQAEAFGPSAEGIDPIRGDVAAIVDEFQQWDDLWNEVIRAASG